MAKYTNFLFLLNTYIKLLYHTSMKVPRCDKCNKVQDKEDIKFGCARCEWQAHGMDVPK